MSTLNKQLTTFFIPCDPINLHFPLSSLLCTYCYSAISGRGPYSVSDREGQCNDPSQLLPRAAQWLKRELAEASAQLQAGSHPACQWLQYMIFC